MWGQVVNVTDDLNIARVIPTRVRTSMCKECSLTSGTGHPHACEDKHLSVDAKGTSQLVIPTRVRTSKNFENQPNGLYLNVVLSKIKESAVMTESLLGSTTDSTPLVADSNISLSQLFSNVNPSDKRFLKYVPDNFSSAEQIEAKREVQKIDHLHACGDKS